MDKDEAELYDLSKKLEDELEEPEGNEPTPVRGRDYAEEPKANRIEGRPEPGPVTVKRLDGTVVETRPMNEKEMDAYCLEVEEEERKLAAIKPRFSARHPSGKSAKVRKAKAQPWIENNWSDNR